MNFSCVLFLLLFFLFLFFIAVYYYFFYAVLPCFRQPAASGAVVNLDLGNEVLSGGARGPDEERWRSPAPLEGGGRGGLEEGAGTPWSTVLMTDVAGGDRSGEFVNPRGVRFTNNSQQDGSGGKALMDAF